MKCYNDCYTYKTKECLVLHDKLIHSQQRREKLEELKERRAIFDKREYRSWNRQEKIPVWICSGWGMKTHQDMWTKMRIYIQQHIHLERNAPIEKKKVFHMQRKWVQQIWTVNGKILINKQTAVPRGGTHAIVIRRKTS